MKRILFCIVLALLLPLHLAHAHGGQTTEKHTATVEPNGVQQVEILAGSYYFAPNHIIVKVNVPVAITISEEPGMAPHNIVMASPEAGMAFEHDLSDKAATITFTPTKTGTYPFYCTERFLFFPSHREKGMEGVIEVVE